MKITKEQLRQIIKEQLEEAGPGTPLTTKQMKDIEEAKYIAIGIAQMLRKIVDRQDYLHDYEIKRDINIIRDSLSRVERLTREI